MEYKGYKLIDRDDGRLQTSKARPYDDADYYWAITNDKTHQNIIYKGETCYEWVGSFEEVVDWLEMLNSKITPQITHN